MLLESLLKPIKSPKAIARKDKNNRICAIIFLDKSELYSDHLRHKKGLNDESMTDLNSYSSGRLMTDLISFYVINMAHIIWAFIYE